MSHLKCIYSDRSYPPRNHGNNYIGNLPVHWRKFVRMDADGMTTTTKNTKTMAIMTMKMSIFSYTPHLFPPIHIHQCHLQSKSRMKHFFNRHIFYR